MYRQSCVRQSLAFDRRSSDLQHSQTREYRSQRSGRDLDIWLSVHCTVGRLVRGSEGLPQTLPHVPVTHRDSVDYLRGWATVTLSSASAQRQQAAGAAQVGAQAAGAAQVGAQAAGAAQVGAQVLQPVLQQLLRTLQQRILGHLNFGIFQQCDLWQQLLQPLLQQVGAGAQQLGAQAAGAAQVGAQAAGAAHVGAQAAGAAQLGAQAAGAAHVGAGAAHEATGAQPQLW